MPYAYRTHFRDRSALCTCRLRLAGPFWTDERINAARTSPAPTPRRTPGAWRVYCYRLAPEKLLRFLIRPSHSGHADDMPNTLSTALIRVVALVPSVMLFVAVLQMPY